MWRRGRGSSSDSTVAPLAREVKVSVQDFKTSLRFQLTQSLVGAASAIESM